MAVQFVILAFSTVELRTFCEKRVAAERHFGLKVARKLRERIADLREIDKILELPAGRPHEIPGVPFPNFAVSLGDGYRIIVAANNNKIPVTKLGKIDWSAVDRMKIIKIEQAGGLHA
jgi:hypothetical protein